MTFCTEAFTEEMEITGPVAVKLYVSSDTTDADLFLVLRLFDPNGKEVTFIGSNDPRVPVGLGWLRASHRKLDPKETKPYRPYHTHDEIQPLKPGEPVELDIEILPTSIVVPVGYRLAAVGARQGLRGGRHRRRAAACALPDEGRRPLHPHQSARPPADDFRRQEHAALRRQIRALCAAAGDPEIMTVRAAIIGLGRWGRSLVNAVHGKTDAIQFVAAYTRTRASAEDYCREKQIPLRDRFEDVLADPSIDAVVLATPHSQHAEQVMAATAAGKHIHCEKPLTLDRPSAEKVVAAAKKAGIVLAVGFNRRFHPSVVEIRKRLAAGQLGQVMSMVATHTTSTGQFIPADNWRAQPDEAPGGAITAVGVHSIDHMIEFAGPCGRAGDHRALHPRARPTTPPTSCCVSRAARRG